MTFNSEEIRNLIWEEICSNYEVGSEEEFKEEYSEEYESECKRVVNAIEKLKSMTDEEIGHLDNVLVDDLYDKVYECGEYVLEASLELFFQKYPDLDKDNPPEDYDNWRDTEIYEKFMMDCLTFDIGYLAYDYLDSNTQDEYRRQATAFVAEQSGLPISVIVHFCPNALSP